MPIIFYETETANGDGDYLVEDQTLPGDIILQEDGYILYLEDGFSIYPEYVTVIEDLINDKYLMVESTEVTNPDLDSPDGFNPILFINNSDRTRYEICQRTGFRQLPTWHPYTDFSIDGYGEYVRKRSVDPQHPQDKIKSRGNAAQKGPQFAEADNTFLSDTVDVEDL